MAIVFLLSFLLFFTLVRLISRSRAKRAARRFEAQQRAWIREEVEYERRYAQGYDRFYTEQEAQTPVGTGGERAQTQDATDHGYQDAADDYAYEFDRGFMEELGISPHSLYPDAHRR